MKQQNSYQRDPGGIAQALSALKAAVEYERQHPPDPDDLSWQNDLPELPVDESDDAVHVEVAR